MAKKCVGDCSTAIQIDARAQTPSKLSNDLAGKLNSLAREGCCPTTTRHCGAPRFAQEIVRQSVCVPTFVAGLTNREILGKQASARQRSGRIAGYPPGLRQSTFEPVRGNFALPAISAGHLAVCLRRTAAGRQTASPDCIG